MMKAVHGPRAADLQIDVEAVRPAPHIARSSPLKALASVAGECPDGLACMARLAPQRLVFAFRIPASELLILLGTPLRPKIGSNFLNDGCG